MVRKVGVHAHSRACVLRGHAQFTVEHKPAEEEDKDEVKTPFAEWYDKKLKEVFNTGGEEGGEDKAEEKKDEAKDDKPEEEKAEDEENKEGEEAKPAKGTSCIHLCTFALVSASCHMPFPRSFFYFLHLCALMQRLSSSTLFKFQIRALESPPQLPT